MLRPMTLMTLSAIFTACAACEVSAAAEHVYRVQGEFRRDAVDYEETVREFYRTKISFSPGDSTRFNLALVRDTASERTSYTWNLAVGGVSPHFSLLAGNFFVHLGKGLLAGKRSAFNPDVFSRSGAIHEGDSFTPCSSGNPRYAFQGLALSFRAESADFAVSFHPFYSLRERHITAEEFESGSTGASLGTLDSRDAAVYPHTDPVYVHTHGAMAALTALEIISIRAYYLANNVETPAGDEIALGSGVLGFLGGGFCLEYRDDWISLFYERVLGRTDYRADDGSRGDARGSGFLAGCAFNIPALRASFVYKKTDADYYSPYWATVGEFLGTGFFLDAALTPFSNLEIGASCSSEIKTNTGSSDRESAMAERERVYLTYSLGWLEELRGDMALSRRSEEGRGERRRYRGRIILRPLSFLRLSASGVIQRSEEGDKSRLGVMALGLKFKRFPGLDISCSRADIAQSNPVYESVLPMRNAGIPGIFIRESGWIYAARSTYTFRGFHVSGRVLSQNTDAGLRRVVFEAFAGAMF